VNLNAQQLHNLGKLNEVLNELRDDIIIVPNVRFDYVGWYALATQVLNLDHNGAVLFVQEQFNNCVALIQSMATGKGDAFISAYDVDNGTVIKQVEKERANDATDTKV
jgi:hypothetical protein